MSDSTRIRPPWWLKYRNTVMVALQRRGVGFGPNGPAVLTVPGRKSGRLYEATLRKGRHIERVHLVEIPVDEARPLLREFPIKVPTGIGFMKIAGLVTGPNADEFEKLAGRCPVFRVDTVGP